MQSGSSSTDRVDPGRRRVDDRRAGQHVAEVDPVAQHGRGRCELGARVDALGLGRVGGHVHGDGLAGCDEVAHGVGQVELALGVLRGQAFERRPELGRLEDVDRGVDLSDPELLLARVARLDDRLQRAVAVADDAAVGARVGRLEGEHGRGGAGGAVRLEQRGQQLARDRGRIAGDDEHVAVEAFEARAGRRGGVAGAARRLLHGDGLALEGLARVGRGDDHERLGPERPHGLDHPVGEPPSEQRVQVLRRGRVHARAESGGQDDRCRWRLGHG